MYTCRSNRRLSNCINKFTQEDTTIIVEKEVNETWIDVQVQPDTEYVINHKLSKLIPHSKIKTILKDRYKFEEVVDMIHDYCIPPQFNDTDRRYYDESHIPLCSNGVPDIWCYVGVEKGRYRDSERVLGCINSRVKNAQLSKVQDICEMFKEKINYSRCVWDIHTIIGNRLDRKSVFGLPTHVRILPPAEEVELWYDTLKACIDPEPYVYSDYTFKPVRGGEEWIKFCHEQMCPLDDPKTINSYFDCYQELNNSAADERSYHDNFMDCVRKFDIDPFKKQEMVCFKGYIYEDRLEKIDDMSIRAKVSECMENRSSQYCRSSKTVRVSSGKPHFDSKPMECLAKAIGYSNYTTYRDEYQNQSQRLVDNNLCRHRNLRLVSNFTSHFTSAAQCFADGPKESDLNVLECYRAIFDSLSINYDKDYILCDLHFRTIKKVCDET